MTQDTRVDHLLQRIASEYDALSKQLKRIAQFMTENRQKMVVLRIRDVARACEVQSSAVVRFAQFFGFSGFSELQAVFREAYASGASPTDYQERIRAVIHQQPAKMKSIALARAFMETCRLGISELSDSLDEAAFEKAVAILQKAQNVYVMGVRRMFPVASYLGYALLQTRKRVIVVDTMGSMYKEQVASLGKGDVLLAISMASYGEETRYCTETAAKQGATVLAMTDSALSPIARAADVSLVVREAEAYHFRAIACTMSLAQSLFIALAYRLELDVAGSRRKRPLDETAK